MKRIWLWFLICTAVSIIGGCIIAPQVNLFKDASDPLEEFRLSGTEEGKVVVIPVEGMISTEGEDQMLRSKPSTVQEVVSQLDLARSDDEVGAVLIKINSTGGSVTASDILYSEIDRFREETGNTVVVALMDYAASGGYYIALPADHILAHPTTVTGSVGVIYLRPTVYGLMDKLGVNVHADTSGDYKDMGSFFRPSTEDEDLLFASMVGSLGERFMEKVRKHRNLTEDADAQIRSARIYLAEEALAAGMVDSVGYLPDALREAKMLAGLHENSKVVVYRRTRFANDNIYNPVTMRAGSDPSVSVETGLPRQFARTATGFYYLWLPGLENN